MNYEVLEALGRITREKNLEREVLLDDLQAGLLAAARRQFGPEARVDIVVDEEGGEIRIVTTKTVVEDVENPDLELDPIEASEHRKGAKVGDEVQVELSLEDFGRNAIQAAKQVVVQRVREAERERVHDEFQGRLGEIVTGTVQQVDRGNVIVNLGRTEALLPLREQIRRESFHQGDTVRAYILDVQKTTKGPQVILSRTHPGFLKKLFELEVPEIFEGTVEIRAVAREAGGRSKVAVSSNDDRVDAVGACVGMKGSRVQSVVREVSGERIDIIQWSPDSVQFVTKALSPAKVTEIEIDEKTHSMSVVVAEDQLSLAIGKGGQNARLAAKLTGWHLDLVSETERDARREIHERLVPGVEKLPGVGEKMAEALREEGLSGARDVHLAPLGALIAVPGVGEKTAEKMKAAAAEIMEQVEAEIEKVGEQIAEQRAAAQAERMKAEEEQRKAEEAARAALLGALGEPGGEPSAEEADESAEAEAAAEDEPLAQDEDAGTDNDGAQDEVPADEEGAVEEAAADDEDAVGEEAVVDDEDVSERMEVAEDAAPGETAEPVEDVPAVVIEEEASEERKAPEDEEKRD
jgi:N utilization substance protein A